MGIGGAGHFSPPADGVRLGFLTRRPIGRVAAFFLPPLSSRQWLRWFSPCGRNAIISSPQRRDASGGQFVRVSEQTVLRLKEWRKRRNGSISEIIDEAIDLYGRLRRPVDMTAYERLSPRLREVLGLIAEGHSTKEMAFRLGVSPKTVEFHRGRLMKLLDIHG